MGLFIFLCIINVWHAIENSEYTFLSKWMHINVNACKWMHINVKEGITTMRNFIKNACCPGRCGSDGYPVTKRLQVRFLVKVHNLVWVRSRSRYKQSPACAHIGGNQSMILSSIDVFLSPSVSLKGRKKMSSGED